MRYSPEKEQETEEKRMFGPKNRQWPCQVNLIPIELR